MPEMFLKGTASILVHPSKVEEMERKGWSLSPGKGKSKSKSKDKEGPNGNT
jgi:hypothetical protein